MAIELLLVLPPLFLAFLIFFSFRSNVDSTPNLPPGAVGWPFIGETLPFMQPHSSSTLGSFLDHHIAKYGKIFRMNFLGKPTIVSADPEFNKYILQSEGRAFEASCPPSVYKIMGRWSMSALVGDDHREMRSIALGFMNAVKLRTLFLPHVEQQALSILDSWTENTTFSAHEEAKKFAFNLMVKHLMNMDPEMPETETVRVEYNHCMKGMASFPLNIPGTSYRRAFQAREVILKIMGDKLDETVKKVEEKGSKEPEDHDDLLTVVAKQNNLTKEQILDLMLSMLFAGHETTAAAVALAIFFLQSSPTALEQLREEHEQIARRKKECGETTLKWEDYKQMDFTQCVIYETLRLGNVIKFVPRRAIKDIQFKGLDIPQGWEVVPILSAAHLDPALHEGPQNFSPWRWQRVVGSGAMGENTMPFSGGGRLCPGRELAKMEIAVFLHYLVQKFDWELADHDYPISRPFFVFPKHLPITVHART